MFIAERIKHVPQHAEETVLRLPQSSPQPAHDHAPREALPKMELLSRHIRTKLPAPSGLPQFRNISRKFLCR